MTAHSPRAGLGAVTAAGRDGPAATPCCVAPGRATPSAGHMPTTVLPYVGRSAAIQRGAGRVGLAAMENAHLPVPAGDQREADSDPAQDKADWFIHKSEDWEP